MNIHISIDAPDAETARREMKKLLGTSASDLKAAAAAANRFDGLGTGDATAETTEETTGGALGETARDAAVTGLGMMRMDENGNTERVDPEEFRNNATEAATEIDTRPLGEPADGKSRRNKDQKADDDMMEALCQQKGVPIETMNGAIAQAGRAEAVRQLRERPDAEKKAEAPVAPAEPEDDAATQAQDAADEATETEANGGLAPIDELRRLVGEYQKKHGMPAAIGLCEEGGAIGKGIHELDEGEIPAAIEAVNKAMGAPVQKDIDPGDIPSFLDKRGEGKTEEKPAEPEAPAATVDDLKKAMLRYAKKFDGQDTDMKAMPATMEDCPKIFALLFGENVTKLSQVPADGYGKAVAAIDEAIAKNPFERTPA